MAKRIGLGQVSLLDLNDAIVSGNQPVNPSIGIIWVDESVSPSMMKKWDGNKWIELGELDPDMSVTIESIKKTLGNMSNDNMIDFQERKVLKDKINEIIGTVIANTATLMPTGIVLDDSGKGSYAQVRSSAIRAGLSTSNFAYILLHSRYNLLRNYLNNLNPKPWDLSDSNKDKVSEVDKDEFRNTWLQYYLAVESLIEATTAQLKKNVDDVEVGGRNLLLGTSNDFVRYNQLVNWGDYSPYERVEAVEGQQYTASVYLKSDEANEKNLYIRVRCTNENGNWSNDGDFSGNIISPGEEGYSTVTFTFPKDVGFTQIRVMIIRATASGDSRIIADYKEAKLEKGNKKTDWTLAPEDTEREIEELFGKITQVESRITDEAIINKVTSSERYRSDFSSVENGLGSVVSRMDTAEQKITDTNIVATVRQSTQYKSDLTGKVSTDEIISAFNQSAEGFLMDGRKIDLNGVVTFGTFNSDVQDRITQGTTANNKLNSTEFNTVSNNYYFEKSIANGSGGRWYRIARCSGSGSQAGYRAHGKFMLRDVTSSQHGTAVFEAGINFGRSPYINLMSYGVYASASFSKARIVFNGTYDEVYLEVYIDNNARAQNLSFWLTDNIQDSGWVGLNWTNGSIPSGYKTFERIIDGDNVTQGTVDKWKYSNTTEIDGGAIRTNTVTASQIDVDNLFANSAFISKIQAIDVTAARIVGGILESTNGRTKINLNTGLIQTQNTNFELGGGSDIEFTDTSNRLYFNRGVSGSAGLGVTTSGFVDKLPIAFMGTASTNSFTATDDANFSGFIANRMQRYWEDGIGNSVIGHRFDIRNSTAAFRWGYIFDIQGTYKEMYGMNANTYEYNLGKVTNPFRRIFVHNVLSDNGYIRFRNGYSGYDNQGFTMETTYGSENHLHFRGTNSNDYWNLGKPGGWRFSYVYLVYQPDVSSDERLKEDIKDSNLGLSFINDIKTKSFKLINNNPKLEDEPTQYGLIAQDLREALMKHNVNIDNINMLSQGSDGMYGVQYSQLITPTIKAVQELNQIVINLRNNFNLTVQENERLVLKVSKLESEINELKNK